MDAGGGGGGAAHGASMSMHEANMTAGCARGEFTWLQHEFTWLQGELAWAQTLHSRRWPTHMSQDRAANEDCISCYAYMIARMHQHAMHI
eukprot:355862-Chlamydomonas_euryale.AAC.2